MKYEKRLQAIENTHKKQKRLNSEDRKDKQIHRDNVLKERRKIDDKKDETG